MSKRLLVVEDDEDIRQNLGELLSSEGYCVDLAENGLRALERLSELPELPSVILLDLMMPVMDAVRFRAEQRARPRFSEIPVVLMTADGRIEDQGKTLGVKDHLKKPLEIDDVLSTVSRYCGNAS
jgi:two-component system, chemotaxis family, chemotaxis protein CheY